MHTYVYPEELAEVASTKDEEKLSLSHTLGEKVTALIRGYWVI